MRKWFLVLALCCHREKAVVDAGGNALAVLDGAGTEVWRCVLAREVDIGTMQNGQQVRRLAEQAYESGEETYPEALEKTCLPALGRWRQQVAALPDRRGGYAASLASLEAALRVYAQRLRAREGAEELDGEIVHKARAWHLAGAKPTAESVAYDRFLRCAIPSLDDLASGQAVYEFLARQCFQQNPAPFIERVRQECGPLLEGPAPKPARSYEATRKRLQDPEGRQAQSWESCTELAREQHEMLDGRELAAAVDQYLAARAALASGR
jgi:hypothetical protein